MNLSFYESRSKEKINDILNEGIMSQAYYRSRDTKTSQLSKLPKLILIVLSILVIVEWMAH